MNTQTKALVCLVTAALLWSSAGVLIKLVDWPPTMIAGIRSLIATFVIWWAFRKERLYLSPLQWFGALAYCGCLIFFVTGTKLTTAANAILLQYSAAPICVALLSAWVLNEKPTRRDWFTIAAVLIGMTFFFMEKLGAGGMMGNLSSIVAGICMGLYIVIMRREKDSSPYGVVLAGNVITFVICLFFWTEVSWSASNIIGIILLGVFQLGLSYSLYSYAIRYVEALKSTLIATIEPLVNPVWVFLMIGERPDNFALIGGVIVLTAITMRYAGKNS